MGHIFGEQAAKTGAFKGEMVGHHVKSTGDPANLILTHQGQRSPSLLLQGHQGRKAEDHIAQGPWMND
jgi:hypothetical protein